MTIKQIFPLFLATGLMLLLGFALTSWQAAEAAVLVTATPSQTAVSPYQPSLAVEVDCSVSSGWQLKVSGQGWNDFEPIALFANGRLRHTLDTTHSGQFEQLWTLGDDHERPLTVVATTGFRRQSITLAPCSTVDTTFLPYIAQAGAAATSATSPDLVLSPDCSHELATTFTVSGSEWPVDEDVALFWNGRLYAQLTAPHNGRFQQQWQVATAPFQTPLLAISSSSGVWRIFSNPCTDPPIPTVTPFGGGPTATPCGAACPPVPTATPWATATENP